VIFIIDVDFSNLINLLINLNAKNQKTIEISVLLKFALAFNNLIMSEAESLQNENFDEILIHSQIKRDEELKRDFLSG
jgi:hypothetical protein